MYRTYVFVCRQKGVKVTITIVQARRTHDAYVRQRLSILRQSLSKLALIEDDVSVRCCENMGRLRSCVLTITGDADNTCACLMLIHEAGAHGVHSLHPLSTSEFGSEYVKVKPI